MRTPETSLEVIVPQASSKPRIASHIKIVKKSCFISTASIRLVMMNLFSFCSPETCLVCDEKATHQLQRNFHKSISRFLSGTIAGKKGLD